jgi:hypothetical protein
VRALLLIALAGCTLGVAGRMEVAYDVGGAPTVRASVDPAIGTTALAQAGDVAHQPAVFALLSVGVGWSSDGAVATFGLDAVGVPAPGGGLGAVGGLRVRLDRRCVRWSLGGGAAALLAQVRAEDRADAFGPNPRLTRAYQDATAFVGWASCDERVRAMIGAAYEVGVAELLFAPGP